MSKGDVSKTHTLELNFFLIDCLVAVQGGSSLWMGTATIVSGGCPMAMGDWRNHGDVDLLIKDMENHYRDLE